MTDYCKYRASVVFGVLCSLKLEQEKAEELVRAGRIYGVPGTVAGTSTVPTTTWYGVSYRYRRVEPLLFIN
jgi:hypothetical protein